MGSDIWVSGQSDSVRMVNLSDEEVMSDSRNPKKRDGRKKIKETKHPIYCGVRKKNPRKWVFEVHELNKNTGIWLETFPTAKIAACAHDVMAIASAVDMRGSISPT